MKEYVDFSCSVAKNKCVICIEYLEFAWAIWSKGANLVPNLVVDIIEYDGKHNDKQVGGEGAPLPDASALFAVGGVSKGVFDSKLRAVVEGFNNSYYFTWDSNSVQCIYQHALINLIKGFGPVEHKEELFTARRFIIFLCATHYMQRFVCTVAPPKPKLGGPDPVVYAVCQPLMNNSSIKLVQHL